MLFLIFFTIYVYTKIAVFSRHIKKKKKQNTIILINTGCITSVYISVGHCIINKRNISYTMNIIYKKIISKL